MRKLRFREETCSRLSVSEGDGFRIFKCSFPWSGVWNHSSRGKFQLCLSEATYCVCAFHRTFELICIFSEIWENGMVFSRPLDRSLGSWIGWYKGDLRFLLNNEQIVSTFASTFQWFSYKYIFLYLMYQSIKPDCYPGLAILNSLELFFYWLLLLSVCDWPPCWSGFSSDYGHLLISWVY